MSAVAAFDVLLDYIRGLIAALPEVTTAQITPAMMIRASSPNRVSGKKAITFLWIPAGRERQFGEEVGRMVITVCSPDVVEAESLQGVIVNGLDYEARCGTNLLTVWQFDHTGGLPASIHNDDLNLWQSEAQFLVRYG